MSVRLIRSVYLEIVPNQSQLKEVNSCVHWATAKDLDTVDTVQVWDSVWSDTDIHSDHLRILKSQDLEGVRKTNLFKKI